MSEMMDGSNEPYGFDGIEPMRREQILENSVLEMATDDFHEAAKLSEQDERDRRMGRADAYMYLSAAGADTVRDALDLIAHRRIPPNVVAGWIRRDCLPHTNYFLHAFGTGYPEHELHIAGLVARNDQAQATVANQLVRLVVTPPNNYVSLN